MDPSRKRRRGRPPQIRYRSVARPGFAHGKTMFFAIIHFLIGISYLILGVVAIVTLSWGHTFGCGFWSGPFFMVAGIFGMLAYNKKSNATIISFMVFSCMSGIISLITVALSAVGLSPNKMMFQFVTPLHLNPTSVGVVVGFIVLGLIEFIICCFSFYIGSQVICGQWSLPSLYLSSGKTTSPPPVRHGGGAVRPNRNQNNRPPPPRVDPTEMIPMVNTQNERPLDTASREPALPLLLNGQDVGPNVRISGNFEIPERISPIPLPQDFNTDAPLAQSTPPPSPKYQRSTPGASSQRVWTPHRNLETPDSYPGSSINALDQQMIGSIISDLPSAAQRTTPLLTQSIPSIRDTPSEPHLSQPDIPEARGLTPPLFESYNLRDYPMEEIQNQNNEKMGKSQKQSIPQGANLNNKPLADTGFALPALGTSSSKRPVNLHQDVRPKEPRKKQTAPFPKSVVVPSFLPVGTPPPSYSRKPKPSPLWDHNLPVGTPPPSYANAGLLKDKSNEKPQLPDGSPPPSYSRIDFIPPSPPPTQRRLFENNEAENAFSLAEPSGGNRSGVNEGMGADNFHNDRGEDMLGSNPRNPSEESVPHVTQEKQDPVKTISYNTNSLKKAFSDGRIRLDGFQPFNKMPKNEQDNYNFPKRESLKTKASNDLPTVPEIKQSVLQPAELATSSVEPVPINSEETQMQAKESFQELPKDLTKTQDTKEKVLQKKDSFREASKNTVTMPSEPKDEVNVSKDTNDSVFLETGIKATPSPSNNIHQEIRAMPPSSDNIPQVSKQHPAPPPRYTDLEKGAVSAEEFKQGLYSQNENSPLLMEDREVVQPKAVPLRQKDNKKEERSRVQSNGYNQDIPKKHDSKYKSEKRKSETDQTRHTPVDTRPKERSHSFRENKDLNVKPPKDKYVMKQTENGPTVRPISESQALLRHLNKRASKGKKPPRRSVERPSDRRDKLAKTPFLPKNQKDRRSGVSKLQDNLKEIIFPSPRTVAGQDGQFVPPSSSSPKPHRVLSWLKDIPLDAIHSPPFAKPGEQPRTRQQSLSSQRTGKVSESEHHSPNHLEEQYLAQDQHCSPQNLDGAFGESQLENSTSNDNHVQNLRGDLNDNHQQMGSQDSYHDNDSSYERRTPYSTLL